MLAAFLAAAGCHRGDDDAAASAVDAPATALRATLDRLRQNDVNGFWRLALAPSRHAAVRAAWSCALAQVPMTPARQAWIDHALDAADAPGAAALLSARWQPRLAQAERQYGDQLPLLAGVGRSLLTRNLAAGGWLDPPQQADAETMLAALAPWAGRAPWFDPARAWQLAELAVETTRTLQLQNTRQALALNLDQAAAKASTVLAAAKRALALYGLSVDAALDSARVTPLTQRADEAIVQVSYMLAGQPLEVTVRMQRIDGRWVSRALDQAAQRGVTAAAVPPGGCR
jgi:hypothetical protein